MTNEIKISGRFVAGQTISNLLPNAGDFMYVKLTNIDGESTIGIFVCLRRYHYYFWSDDNRFNGSGGEFANENGWSYSWKLSEHIIDNDITSMTVLNNRGWSERFGYPIQIEPTKKPVYREEQAIFVNKKYATTIMYSGISGYHSGREYNQLVDDEKPSDYRIGVELEVECNSSAIRRTISAMFKSNWLLMERDGSLSDNGIEFITVPMRQADIKKATTWSPFIEYMADKARSWNTSTCGLHVHIGREILGNTAEEQSETLGKLLYLYHHWLKDHETNIKIYGRSRAYHEQDGKVREGDAVKTLGSKVLKVKDVKDNLKAKLTERSLRDRYFDINNRNAFTIEFRKGRGSLNTNRIISVIEYSELMCLYCRKVKWENISDVDFFTFARKKVKRHSPLCRFISNEEMDS